MHSIVFALAFLFCTLGTSQQVSAPSSTKTLEFAPFFKKFCRDEAFQLAHTHFPMERWTIELEDDFKRMSKIAQADWEPLKFDRKRVLMPLGGESVKQVFVRDGDNIRMEIRGTASCIYNDYEFRIRSGAWMLVAEKIYSN